MTEEPRLRELYQRALATRDGGGRERCASPEEMLALIRRDGPEDERLATLDHVMACEACSREFELLRAIEAAGASVAASGASDGATVTPITAAPAVAGGRPPGVFTWRRAVVPLALAASIVVAVGVGVRDRFGRDGADVMRGESDAAVTLLTPPTGADVAAVAPLTFAWRPDPGARRYVFEVLDAEGRAVITESTTDTVVTVRDVGRLAPGSEYRWWVRAVGDGGTERGSAVRSLRVRDQ